MCHNVICHYLLPTQRRDHLTRIKQARDSLRMDNIRLRQRGGLVAHSALLRDYEERKDQVCAMSLLLLVMSLLVFSIALPRLCI